MSYSYTETLRSKTKKTEVIYSADKTATYVTTAKSYAISAVASVNGESASDFESKHMVIESPTTDTGFVNTGDCDINLICEYTGNNSQIAQIFSLEILDMNIANVNDFKDAISASLTIYYPAVTLAQLIIKTAVFKFHE